ncbi:MAG: ribose 1,5-bisphosphate isomerase [Thermoplasmata archaeon]|nr:MAG: ribose 1,5-bisphosphate isomerase [Thermoplasmata archaeon]
MVDDVLAVAEKIRNMEIRGAARIARAAAEALENFAKNYDGTDFIGDLGLACRALYGTRPTAVSLWNAIHSIVHDLEGMENEEARAVVIKRAKEFTERSEMAVERIGEIGAKRIFDGCTILTHCNSSAALATIIRAHKDGKNIEVIATESRPKRQGYITARQLMSEGVRTTLIVDSAVRYFMKEVDLVFVGADAIASNGVVINKIGTSQIALCAHEARVPFYVCAESYKFSPKTLGGEYIKIEERDVKEVVDPADVGNARIRNPVFDATPPEYIDGIITEYGIISPYAAYEIIIHQFGQKIMFEKEWWL